MLDDDALLSPQQLTEELAELGLNVAVPTLASLRTRGGGPPFRKFGKAVRYTWGSSLAWARSRLSPAVSSTSELKPRKAAP